MSEAPVADSLVQRFAVRRLSGPGVIDRRALQRAHERSAPSSRSQLLDRLQRRVGPPSSVAESLPLVRAARSADVVATDSNVGGGGRAPAHAQVVSAATAAANSGTPVASGTLARTGPVSSRTPAIVARRVADTPGLVGGTSATTRLLTRSELRPPTIPG